MSPRPQPHPSGFAQTDALMLLGGLLVLLMLGGILMPSMSHCGRTAPQMKNSSQQRGIHQSMVIFSQDNNGHLPGLDANGDILLASASPFMGTVSRDGINRFTGASMSARYYLLLNGKYVAGDLLINPQETQTAPVWERERELPTTAQFSYSLLRIGTGPMSTQIGGHTARAKEWRDNANSQAILISDRNTAATAESKKVRSLWSTAPLPDPDWKGTVLWGDNHAEFMSATNGRLGTLSLNTKYAGVVNSDDFLFAESGGPGKSATASAMFGYTPENF